MHKLLQEVVPRKERKHYYQGTLDWFSKHRNNTQLQTKLNPYCIKDQIPAPLSSNSTGQSRHNRGLKTNSNTMHIQAGQCGSHPESSKLPTNPQCNNLHQAKEVTFGTIPAYQIQQNSVFPVPRASSKRAIINRISQLPERFLPRRRQRDRNPCLTKKLANVQLHIPYRITPANKSATNWVDWSIPEIKIRALLLTAKKKARTELIKQRLGLSKSNRPGWISSPLRANPIEERRQEEELLRGGGKPGGVLGGAGWFPRDCGKREGEGEGFRDEQ